MKILHVAESVRGGCGTYLNEIIPLQVGELGAGNVRALVPRQHASQLEDVDPSIVLSFERASRLAGIPRLALAVLRAVWRHRPELIHVHSSIAGAVVRGLSFLPGMPAIVYCPHGWAFDMEVSGRSRGVIRFVERLLARRCQRIVAISEAEQKSGAAAGIPREKITLVPNGIRDLAPGRPAAGTWNDVRTKVLFVGRLDRQKGVDILLRAVRGLEERISLRVIGDRVASAEGAEDPAAGCPHVQLMGWMDQKQVAEQMGACDLLIMPSRWEGFGLVAIEGMRAGKPVFASAVGGLREIVVDGVTGHLFEPGDETAIRALLERYTPSELNAMGEAGRARFLGRYTSNRTHAGLMSLYREALGREPAPELELAPP